MVTLAGEREVAMVACPRASLLTRRTGVVFASTVGASMGLSQTFLGVFGLVLVPISKEFGWSRTLVSGVMSLTFIKSLALTLATGWLLDRFGSRHVLLAGLGLYSAALLLFAMAPPNVPAFYALFALVCMLGAPMSSTTFAKTLAGWFDKGRGAMIGFAAGIGAGTGSALFPVLAGILLPQFGWRGVFFGVALIVAVVGIPITFFFFRDPPVAAPIALQADAAPPLQGHRLGEALRTPVFWVLVTSIGTCAGCMTAMFSQVVPVAQEAGFTLKEAVAAVTVLAGVCAIAQWLIGALIDRFSRPLIMVPFYLLGTFGLWLIHNSEGFAMLLLSTGLMGVSLGAEYSALPLLLSRYFGVAHFGKIACLVYGIVAVLTGVIPVGMNRVFDITGAYAPALTIMECGLLVATVLILPLPNYKDGAGGPATLRLFGRRARSAL
ncbi:MFS transporter [Rhizorhabdus sp.]|jgi:MFS family permease|uniref:MFS transporter n=1 Tax=Rhizorhabdus sp. TaxID=1968843 RepID=UPI0019CABECB|nr:MFS transporter [Rhizorhabdus sp.]MBD3760404.1 MFS transporter [Rhizorhabdus sp.]